MKKISAKGRGLSAMCRLCLSKDATLLDIFSFSPETRIRLLDIIMRCAPVQIRRHDGMPNFICRLCHIQLDKIHEFQMKIVQSDKTLRYYLQQLHTSDKQVMPGCSTQTSSEEHLLHETNHCDVTVKSESKELPDVLSIDFNTQETEPINLNSTNKINEKMSLKFESKDESPNLIDCADDLVETLSKGEIVSENSVVEISYMTKLGESAYNNIGKEKNLTSMDKINYELPLKLEIKNEPADDNSVFLTECVDVAMDNLYKCDDSEICSENTKIDKSEESEKDISVNDNKYKIARDNKFQCDVCNKCFSQSSHLVTHKRTHTGEKPYRCDVCSKRFVRLDALNHHIRTHTGEKPYNCDVCNKCFSQSSNLISHKRTHTGEKPYQCDICNKSFTVSSNLISHKRIHTGEKPHKCDVCNKCFIRSSDLIPHKRMHTGEKPYQCDVCNKCFSRSGDLIPHKRIHTGEKPYQCDVCNKCFTVSRTLIVHKRTHTGEK